MVNSLNLKRALIFILGAINGAGIVIACYGMYKLGVHLL